MNALTQDLAGDLFWFLTTLLTLLILLGVIAGLKALAARQSARWAVDLPTLQDPPPDNCQLQRCPAKAAATIYFANTRMRICEAHVALVCAWVGANPAPVYDQELAHGDFAAWDREVGA